MCSIITIKGCVTIISFCLLTTVCAIREEPFHWLNLGKNDIESALNVELVKGRAKNVILFLGDGMGPTTVTASRIYSEGEGGYLAFEKFPHVGVLKTYSADKYVPDSCSTATALFCGVKTNYKTSGVDSSVTVDDCEASLKQEAQLESIMSWAQKAGKSTGFVTTTRVTHATPSALFSHTPNRKWECEAVMPESAKNCKDIARQLVEDEPGKNINVIMGGGRQCLQSHVKDSDSDPLDTWSCQSFDGRDLIRDWKLDKISRNLSHSLVTNSGELDKTDDDAEFVLGIFANGHLKPEHARDKSPEGMPSLRNMTLKALRVLAKNEAGYVLMVEGGLIDFSHHRGHAKQALSETAAFSDAIKAALNHVDFKDTLVIVTSDHAHSMVLSGYADRGTSILGLAQASKMDKIPYTSLLYGTGGPDNFQYSVVDDKVTRHDPTQDDLESFEYAQQAAVLTDEVTHSGSDVLVYATGPMAHLFHSVHEQTYVAYVISYAARIGPFSNVNFSSAKTHNSCIVITLLCIFLVFIIKFS